VNLDTILQLGLKFFNNPQIQQQLLIVLSAFFASSLTQYAFRFTVLKRIKERIETMIFRTENEKETLFQKLKTYLNPFLVYLTSVIWLSVAVLVANALVGDSKVVQLAIQCLFVWILTTYVSLFSGNRSLGTIVGTFLILGIVMNYLNLLNPIIELLDGYSISLGSVHISVLSVLKSILVMSIVVWVSSAISSAGKSQIQKSRGLKPSTKEVLIKVLDITLVALVTIIVLNSVGIDLTALTVIGGALGVGVGFGLQKITSNFISGLILLFEKSIKIGDLIQIDNSIHGWIRHLGSRFTLIETFDGTEIMIPNDDFITSRVTNWTYSNTKGRIFLDIGVSYNSDMDQVKGLLEDAAKEYSGTALYPKPVVYMREFGDSAVVFSLSLFINDASNGIMLPKSDILFSIWRKFKEHNVEIPFPHRDIHIKSS
jgi:small-conductance mechanosensitive channel